MFDAKEYVEAVDEFLYRMDEIQEIEDPASFVAIERIARLFRIAKIKVSFLDDNLNKTKATSKELLVYESGPSDEQQVYEQRMDSKQGYLADYYVYLSQGGAKWSQEERDRLRMIVRTLFVFHERLKIRSLINTIAYHDIELGVYNFNHFMKQLEVRIAQGVISDYIAAYFNMRRFSMINREYGRDVGTEVLKSYVTQLQEKIGQNGIVSRMGGDNFMVLFLKEQLDMVKPYLEETYVTSQLMPEASVALRTYAGFYLVPSNDVLATDVMDRAMIALNAAKTSSNSCVFFDEELCDKREYEKRIESDFQAAIEQNEIRVYYQPKVVLKDYSLAGAEALCRWFHNGEMVMPGDFIPALERSDAICTLDFHMLELVCIDLSRWLEEGRKVVKVSVNFSRRHAQHKGVAERILSIVDKYKVPHQYVEIELTETTQEGTIQSMKEIVKGLQQAGISTSVDDFGIGYSSLNLIREFAWNVLKIDKSFLPNGNQTDSKKYIMFKYLIPMIQAMGLECIVEGVETIEQVKLLKENNCFLAQGFYFDMPLPVEVFESRLDDIK